MVRYICTLHELQFKLDPNRHTVADAEFFRSITENFRRGWWQHWHRNHYRVVYGSTLEEAANFMRVEIMQTLGHNRCQRAGHGVSFVMAYNQIPESPCIGRFLMEGTTVPLPLLPEGHDDSQTKPAETSGEVSAVSA